MADSNRANVVDCALSQYSIVERIFSHLDYQTAKNMASLRAAWRSHGMRRTDQSEPRFGEFLSGDDLEPIMTSMESSAGPPSVVFFFFVSSEPELRSRLERFLLSRANTSWSRTIVVLGRSYFRFFTKEEKMDDKRAVSFLSLPAGVPVKTLTDSQFAALKNCDFETKREYIIFTSKEFDFTCEPNPKRMRESDEVSANAVGGIFNEVWCKLQGETTFKDFHFLVLAISSVSSRLAVTVGQTRKKPDKLTLPIVTGPTCVLAFPCAALQRESPKYRTNLSLQFSGLNAVVGGFTGGEWFGKFARRDLISGLDLLMYRLQKAYSFLYVGFTPR